MSEPLQIQWDCDSLGWYWRYVPSPVWYGPYSTKEEAERDIASGEQ